MNIEQKNFKKTKIANIEKYTYLLYKHAEGNLLLIKEYADKLNISLEDFLEYATHYIIKNKNNPVYVQIMDKLIKLSEDKYITFLDQCNFNVEHIEQRALKYITEFRPIFLFNEEKRTLLLARIYEYKKHILNKKMKKQNVIIQPLNEHQLNIIMSFISSKYSLERFCFQHRFLMNTIKKLESPLKIHHEKLYHAYLRKLKQIDEFKEQEIINDTLKLLELVKNSDTEFESIDFFQNTLFGIKEILKTADSILTPEDNKILRMGISKIKDIKVFSEKSIEGIFKEKTILNINNELINIPFEVKLTIVNYLQEQEIPISNITLKEAYFKYYNNTLFDNIEKKYS